MVERKSVASLANTSFIVVLPGMFLVIARSKRRAIQSFLMRWIASLRSHDVLYSAPADAAGSATLPAGIEDTICKIPRGVRAANAIASPTIAGRPGT